MAVWNRRSREDRLAARIVEELSKGAGSLAGSPYAGAQTQSVGPMVPQVTPAMLEVFGAISPMLRDYDTFSGPFAPAPPLLPAPIDPLLPATGRPLPRKYEYQVAINLNLTQTEVPYTILRSLAQQCDMVHRAIQIRIADITKQSWSFTLTDQCINGIMESQGVSHAKAARLGRERYGEEISRLAQFWENPYLASGRGWVEWITEALWQVLVFDQLCIYPRYTVGRDLKGLDVIDAATIKLLLDVRGDIPHPPAPAFQQILWGFPRGEFAASPDSDVEAEFFTGLARGIGPTDQLAVYVHNRRTWSPYGFSPVEQAIPAATFYLNRQNWMASEYRDGSTPRTWMRSSSKMDLRDLAPYERILNDRLAGQNAERHRVKLLPEGFDPVPMPSLEDVFKPDLDEWAVKKIAAIFGVSPSQLGVIARAGLGGGKGAQEGEAENSETVSLRPLENFIVEFVNGCCRRFLGADPNVTFSLEDTRSAMAEATQAEAYQKSLFSGWDTLNDIRGATGQPLYDMPEADEPFIVAGNTVTFLKGMLDAQLAPPPPTIGGSHVGESAANPVRKPEEGAQAPSQVEGGASHAEAPSRGGAGSQGEGGQGPEGGGPAAKALVAEPFLLEIREGDEAEATILEISDPDKAAEARRYVRFSSQPRSRPFRFEFLSEPEAAALKAALAADARRPVHAY